MAKVRPFDILAGAIVLLLGIGAPLFQYGRFVQYRGQANIVELYVYAVVCFAVLCITWISFRDRQWDRSLLLLIGVGVALHVAGSIPLAGGGRVYDLVAAGIRYDKLVHFFNSFVAARVVLAILRFEGASLGRLESLVVVLTVLGVGAAWEIVEYAVVRTVPHNGVGEYDNNMLDLVANLAGSICSVWLYRLVHRDDPPPEAGGEEEQ